MFGRINPPGLVYKIDLSKIADRENPRTVEAPINGYYQEDITIDWGDGTSDTFSRTGNTNIQANGTQYPSHEYAASGIYTVVIRSVNGKLPLIHCNDTASSSEPERNISFAVVSLDHFGGTCAEAVKVSRNNLAKKCYNLTYIDTRLCGEPTMRNAPFMCNSSAIQQSIESFCFDFTTELTDFGSAFYNCSGLTGAIPEHFFDNCTTLTVLSTVFYGCTGLTAPYIFWGADGEIDTAKFPNLVKSRAAAAYSGCTGMDRSQIPSAYGGTMSVS